MLSRWLPSSFNVQLFPIPWKLNLDRTTDERDKELGLAKVAKEAQIPLVVPCHVKYVKPSHLHSEGCEQREGYLRSLQRRATDLGDCHDRYIIR